MVTIDGINTNILRKIKILKDLMKICHREQISVDDLRLIYFNEMSEKFEYGSVRILAEYYFLDGKNDKDYMSKKDVILNKYVNFIIQNNYLYHFDNIYYWLKQKLHLIKNKINSAVIEYENIQIPLPVKKTRGINCIFCLEPLRYIARESALECPKCFSQTEAYGMMFSEDQNNVADKNYKSNQYQSRKHSKEWLDSLQGLESKDIPQNIIDYVKKCIKKDCIIDLSKVSCEIIRNYLSKLDKASKFNQHIPKIRKIITGIEPPQLTEAETELFYELFGKVINAYNSIKKKVNCPYCPYFIRKILEHILAGSQNTERREKFFSYIHLQLPNTLYKQDEIWAKICKQVPEFEYTPTIRNL